MRKCLLLLTIALGLALVFGTLSLATGAAPQDNAKKEDAKVDKAKCLACHGSFDKLAENTAQYETPSGEKTSPHKYIPHADKKDIPECTECHTPHPVPIQDKEKVVKATVDFCYTSCHHAHNFQPCSTCH
jgi:hypothetical protein